MPKWLDVIRGGVNPASIYYNSVPHAGKAQGVAGQVANRLAAQQRAMSHAKQISENGRVVEERSFYNSSTNTSPYKIVPWKDWTNITDYTNLDGTTHFFGYLPSYVKNDYNRFLILNNTDSTLYISGSDIDTRNILSDPDIIIHPFRSFVSDVPGNFLAMVACCFGYDFTSKRYNLSTEDSRFSGTSFIQIIPLKRGEDRQVPSIRQVWTRMYDLYDLMFNNSFPATSGTTQVIPSPGYWMSNPMSFTMNQDDLLINIQAHYYVTGTPTYDVYMRHIYKGIYETISNNNPGDKTYDLMSEQMASPSFPTTTEEWTKRTTYPAAGPLSNIYINYNPLDVSNTSIELFDLWISGSMHI